MTIIADVERTFSSMYSTVRNAFTNMSITAKLWISVTIGLLSLMGVFGYLGISAAKESTQEALRERVTLVKMVAGHLDSEIRNVEDRMTSMAKGITGDLDPFAVDPAWLRTTYEQLRPFSQQVFLINRQGEIVRAEHGSSMAGLELQMPIDSVEHTLMTGQFALSDPYPSPDGASAIVLASVAITGADNLVQGALVAALDMTGPEIRAIWDPMGEGIAGYMDIVSQSGQIILSTRPERLLQRSDHEGALSALIQDGTATSGTCHTCHQSARGAEPLPEVMAFAPLSSANWAVVLRQDQAEAFATSQRLRDRILVIGLLAVLGAGVFVWLITDRILRPIKSLTHAARRIAQGDLSTPIDHRSGDEIGELAATFDEMRVQLQASMQEIQDGYRLLDQRVKERTAAYRQAQTEAQRIRDHLQSIIDGLTDELVVVDRDFKVRQANAMVRGRWKRSESLIDQSCQIVNHRGLPCTPPHCTCPVRQVFQTGQVARVTHVHHDGSGSTRFMDIIASPIVDSDGEIREVVELSRDVTEERRVAEALKRRNEALSTLNEISSTVSQSLSLLRLPDLAIDQVMELAHVDAAAMILLDDLEQQPDVHNVRAFRGLSQDLAQALLSQVCSPDRSAIAPRIKRFTGTIHRNGASREGAWVHVPLLASGSVLGSLCVGTLQMNQFSDEDIDLLTAVGQQIAMAAENARLYADLQRKEHRRGILLKQVISAQEEERKRIARDLHDETVQRLTAIIMNCAALEQSDLRNGASAKKQLADVRSTATQAIRNVRRLIFDLRPEALDDLGLELAVRGHVKERLEDAGIRIQIEIAGLDAHIPPEVEITVFRVIQEAVSNIVRHAQASRAHIRLVRNEGRMEIVVQDDGRGFNVERTMRFERQSGWGLHGMAERVALLNGSMDIASRPGEGTSVRIKIPLEG